MSDEPELNAHTDGHDINTENKAVRAAFQAQNPTDPDAQADQRNYGPDLTSLPVSTPAPLVKE